MRYINNFSRLLLFAFSALPALIMSAAAATAETTSSKATVTETTTSKAITGEISSSETVPAEYQPRAGDFVKMFHLVETLSFPGWTPKTTVITDMGAAVSKPPIDPDRATLLTEFRCNEYLMKNLNNGVNSITLELYRFDSPVGAYGAYTSLREGASTVIRRGDGSSEDDSSISFWRNNYLVLLRASAEEDDESKVALIKVADQIAAGIEGNAYVPAILSELPFLDRVSGSERLFMGPAGGRKFSPVHLVTELMLDKCRIGATADYRIAQPYPERLKVMLIDYGNSPVANAAYAQFMNSIAQGGDVQHADSAGAQQAYTVGMFKLAGRYALCQRKGQKIAIICNGRKPMSVAMLANQFNW